MAKNVGLAVLMLLACGGPREPGAKPNDTVYWKVTSSELEFGACSDDASDGGFREQITPVPFGENSYFVYRVSSDAKSASVMSCRNFNATSCVVAEPEQKFDVQGNELQLSEELKNPIGDGGCQLQTARQWVAEDKGTSMTLNVSNALSLVDAPTECTRIENQIKSDSPNGLGVQGCVVTFKLGFSHE